MAGGLRIKELNNNERDLESKASDSEEDDEAGLGGTDLNEIKLQMKQLDNKHTKLADEEANLFKQG